MRLLLLSSLFLSLLFTSAYAQENLSEFGKPDMKELLMKDCDFEPGASAMKILKYERTELINPYEWVIEIETREKIKIFKQSGYKYADIEIPYSKRNKIKNLSAFVYNTDETGNISVTKIDRDDIFKKSEKKKKRGSLIFTFPDLRPGSVIEYRYTEVDKEGYYNDIKFFQDKIPVELSLQQIVYPDDMTTDLTFPAGYENLENTIAENQPVRKRNTQTISCKNINAFRVEQLMSSAQDNLQHMTMRFLNKDTWRDSTLKTSPDYINRQWGIITRRLRYNPFFEGQITKQVPFTYQLIDSAKSLTDVKAKIDYIYKRVKKTIRWNNEEYFVAEDLDRTWKSKEGSNAEINLLILNLLRKVGVECYPILTRSREYGKANRFLFTLGQFNNVNVIVFDKDDYYVLDGTKKYLSYKTLPLEILNRDVLLIDSFNARWITLVDNRPFVKHNISVKAELNTEGHLKGDAFISLFDYLKENYLEEKQDKMSRADEEKDFIEKNTVDIKIDSVKDEDSEDEIKPLNQRFQFTYKPEVSDNFLFLDPFFLSPFRKNPFTDSVRRTDIDFGSNQYYSIYLHLTVPENYTIEEIPKNITIISSDTSIIFKRQTLREENVLVFKHSFEIRRTLFAKEEYLPLHDIFRKMYGAIKEQLILKKK